jgi:glycosyltransferase involved in cell wall biosynthesis
LTIIDIVVAVRNEELNIPRFINEVRSLKIPEAVQLRFLFIEDSSTDGTVELLRNSALQDSDIHYYSLANPFGQVGALSMGLAQATGDAVIMMDVDEGHPVGLLPAMIRHFLDGMDIVQCVRRASPKRAAHRRLGTHGFNFLLWVLTGFRTSTQNVYFRLVSRPVCEEILRNPRNFHFLRITFIDRAGLKVQRLYFNSDERRFGASKYSFLRLLHLSIYAVLSVVSIPRFTLWLLVLGAFAILLWFSGAWPAAVAVFAFMLVLVVKFVSMCREDLLGRLKVLEHS